MGADIWIIIALLVVLVLMTVFRFRSNKKAQTEQVSLIENLRVGDKVKTHIGVYGRILAITETTQGKVFTIETGDKNKSELNLDYRYVAAIDDKELVTYDLQGNVIEPNKPMEVKTTAENVQIEPVKDDIIESSTKVELEKEKKEKKKKKSDLDI